MAKVFDVLEKLEAEDELRYTVSSSSEAVSMGDDGVPVLSPPTWHLHVHPAGTPTYERLRDGQKTSD
jgi:hypothetical protein